jgi:hypothetical protein
MGGFATGPFTTGGFTIGGGGLSLLGAVPSDDGCAPLRFGMPGAGGMLAVGAAPSAGGGPDSRRGLGGGASFFPNDGIEPTFTDGAGSLPGSNTGGGIDERISGRLGVPGGGRLGVPTGRTGTLGIFGGVGAGAGMLSDTEAAVSAFTSASSVVEISGFEVMLV